MVQLRLTQFMEFGPIGDDPPDVEDEPSVRGLGLLMPDLLRRIATLGGPYTHVPLRCVSRTFRCALPASEYPNLTMSEILCGHEKLAQENDAVVRIAHRIFITERANPNSAASKLHFKEWFPRHSRGELAYCLKYVKEKQILSSICALPASKIKLFTSETHAGTHYNSHLVVRNVLRHVGGQSALLARIWSRLHRESLKREHTEVAYEKDHLDLIKQIETLLKTKRARKSISLQNRHKIIHLSKAVQASGCDALSRLL